MQHKLVIAALTCAALVTGTEAAHAQAQNYQPFRFETGLTGTLLPSTGRAGFGAIFEAKLNVHDQIAVGARFEGAVMFGGNLDEDDVTISIGALASTLLKGEYYLTTSTVRPFVGLSLGMYDIVSQTVESSDASTAIDQKAGRYFGVGPQLGFDLGRLRLAATYNLILGADIEVRQQVGTPSESVSEYSQNYFTFELSFRFGGARKPSPPALPPGGYYDPTGPYRPPVTPPPGS